MSSSSTASMPTMTSSSSDELDEIAERRGIELEYVVGDHRTDDGARLLDSEHLHELVPDIEERDVYVCGPPAMTDVLLARLREAGVPRRHIHAERFALLRKDCSMHATPAVYSEEGHLRHEDRPGRTMASGRPLGQRPRHADGQEDDDHRRQEEDRDAQDHEGAVPEYPNHTDRSVFINQNAMPLLVQETLQHQFDINSINVISGATDSSYAFGQSLQAALIAAKKI